MRKQLTDKVVRGLKPEPRRYDVWDSAFTGGAFGVRVSPAGLKSFVLIARDRSGRQKRMTLGAYPEMGLADARDSARSALVDLSKGVDPNRPEGPTFTELADDFIRKHPKMKGLKPRTVKEYRRLLDADLLPAWGKRGVKEITRADVNALLDEIAFERDAPVTANRVLALASVMFNFAIDTGRFGVEVNPCFRLRKRVDEKPRDRVLTDDEIRKLWAELDKRKLATGAVYKLILLTGQRSGEVKAMRRDDIDGDVWTIPAELAKNDRQHRVPLSSQAMSLLEALKTETGEHEHVFPSRVGGALQWLGKNTRRIQDAVGFHFTPHDLRRTAATGMSKLGVDDATIGRVLNHSWAFENVTARVYAVDDRLTEKRKALEQWGVHLERILAEGAEAASDLRLSGRAPP